METETGICDLPADCLALLASLTSPGDVCRLAATATALRAAADYDEVWGSFLPADCADILARCSTADDEHRREGETKKELFCRLCDCPVILDGGKLSFSLDRHSGAKKYMIPAKALWYGWSGYHYGGLVWSRCHPNSRFREVAVLSYLCWVDIDVILNTKNLSGVGRGYAAYLVYMVHWLHADTAQNQNQEDAGGWELEGSPSSSMAADTTEKNGRQKQRPTANGVGMRSDGQWIEQEINIELDKQCPEGKESNVSIEFRGFTRSHRCQIIIEGIEIRPKGMWKFKSRLN
ncbi:F-box protein PP2-B11-like isoform X2 [Hordeum vulgare subsp. vulgare]|uniref:F-box protein PP2-B11-like isoform X2 n=1 Tax=Hordeum vulgare subsp. vulgare TaxID=112509 RepID=UPI00029694DB|nr:F-box protein PP2-B11-like isoform X2 [Hordeum vulgare subsp. vulgare]